MNRTTYLLALIVVVILIGGAYYLGMRQGRSPERASQEATTSPTATAANTPAGNESAQQTDSVGFEVQSPITEALMNLNGTWQDAADARSTRQFGLDKSLTDTYLAGQETQTKQGSYSVFTGADAPADSVFPLKPQDLYLNVYMDGQATTHYRISELTKTKLTLVLLDRGGITTYTKVK